VFLQRNWERERPPVSQRTAFRRNGRTALVNGAVEAGGEENSLVAASGCRGHSGNDGENLLWCSGEADAVVVSIDDGGRWERCGTGIECNLNGIVDALIVCSLDSAVGGLGRERGGGVSQQRTECGDLLRDFARSSGSAIECVDCSADQSCMVCLDSVNSYGGAEVRRRGDGASRTVIGGGAYVLKDVRTDKEEGITREGIKGCADTRSHGESIEGVD
jgi:hypothetical protein